MPTLEEMLPRLTSTLDAKDGFYQIGLDEESSMKTAFWTPFGRYKYLRMPFGVNSAPEEFECKLHEKLDDLPGTFVIRDDILVVGYGQTEEEAELNHDENIVRLLERARQVNLKLNKSKMNFKKKEVKFMGHRITQDSLKPDTEKIRAIKEMPRPTSKKEIQSLLGFVNYLSKFLPRLSEISQPLRDLAVKDTRFIWSSEQERSFNEIEKLVVDHPILRFYDVKEEATLQCDASEKGLGATILQHGQPVAFASRTFSQTEQKYAQIEKECLSIVFACQRFHQYLAGRQLVTVESDHKPLQSIFKTSIHSAPSRLQRMLLRLQQYNLDVKYKPGSEMYLADHLSRASTKDTDSVDDEFQVFSLELEQMNPFDAIKITSERLTQLQKCTAQDTILQTLKNVVQSGWPDLREQLPVHIRDYWNYRDEITVHNGVLFKSQRVIIPQSMRSEILARIHSSHLGMESCIRKAKDSVFWPGMSSQVKEAVTNCQLCAEFQARNQKQPLQSHRIPDRPWSRVAADLFALFGKDYITLVDYYSDFVEVGELLDTTSSSVIKFLKDQFSRHGIPDRVVTDNGSQIVSREFQQFSKDWEFEHVTSSPCYPRSNGKAESAVKIVKTLFKKALKARKDPWLALLDYRNTPTAGIGSSPAQRLMSRRTRTLLPTASTLLKPQVVSNVEEQIRLKRQKAKFYHDRTAKVLPELEIGQEVRVDPLSRNQDWKKGTCTQKFSDRSFAVQTETGTLRRNRQHLNVTPHPVADEITEESRETCYEDNPLSADTQLTAQCSPAKQYSDSVQNGKTDAMESLVSSTYSTAKNCQKDNLLPL